MPRLNVGRTVHAEADLAERIAYERTRHQQSHEKLAERMTEEGCAMAGSSIYKIEKGNPRRRISVDELVVLAKIWDTSVEGLLRPVPFVQQERALEIARAIPDVQDELTDAIHRSIQLWSEYNRLANDSAELLEYVNNQMEATWRRDPGAPTDPSDIDAGLTWDQLVEVNRAESALMDAIIRAAIAAAQVK